MTCPDVPTGDVARPHTSPLAASGKTPRAAEEPFRDAGTRGNDIRMFAGDVDSNTASSHSLRRSFMLHP